MKTDGASARVTKRHILKVLKKNSDDIPPESPSLLI